MMGALPSAPGAKPLNEPIEVGLCVPDVCDTAGIIALIESPLVKMYIPELELLKVSNIKATSPQLDLRSQDLGGTIAVIVVGLLVLLVAASTLVMCLQPSPAAGRPHQTGDTEQQLLPEDGTQAAPGLVERLAKHKLVQAFTLVGKSGTLTKLFEIPAYKPTDSLNGLRVLSMAWIIVGHTFIMAQGIAGYANQADIVESPLNKNTAEQNPLMALIVNAQSSVDTFFYLSAFLLSHLTAKETRQVNVLQGIILRYCRLTPSLALAMLVYYKIWPHFGYGPFAVRFQESILSRCNTSWWSEITYSMNFAPWDSDKVCMGWTWYLGDDMIFFIICIFIMAVYFHRRLAAWFIVFLITGMSFGLTTYFVVRYNLSIYVFDQHYNDYSYWAYSKPYSRIPAYFVGIVAGWILQEMEERGVTRGSHPMSASARMRAGALALFSLAVLLFLLFIPMTDFGDSKNTWSTLASALYINLSRPLWAACFAVLTFLCYYDYLPIFNAFMSHPVWTPLTRLTYGAYLVHPLVIKLAAGRAEQYYTFSAMDMVYRHLGNTVMAYAGAVILWVLVERPTMTLASPARKQSRRNLQATAARVHTQDGDDVLVSAKVGAQVTDLRQEVAKLRNVKFQQVKLVNSVTEEVLQDTSKVPDCSVQCIILQGNGFELHPGEANR
jgi:peptidoglycan/LPS O-acetylase OafA/YrhL